MFMIKLFWCTGALKLQAKGNILAYFSLKSKNELDIVDVNNLTITYPVTYVTLLDCPFSSSLIIISVLQFYYYSSFLM